MSDDRSDAMARFTPNGQHQNREGRLQDRRQDTRGVEGVRIGEGARRGDRVEGLTGLRITELNVTVSDVVATIDGQGRERGEGSCGAPRTNRATRHGRRCGGRRS
jgi:hypothetical protein